MQQQQVSAEQESQIVDWVSKEDSSGTIVRKDLIYWYTQNLLRRDNGVEATLSLDFVDDLISRHPDLAECLVIPPHPDHANPPVVRLNRLEKRMQEDRRKALFGDSPPPPRQPAPYPEGDIIHNLFDRYVVRHDNNKVTKYTRYSHGFGATDHPNEAMVMDFIKANTSIPVPKVFSSAWDRITMEYIEGETLQQAWPVLTPDQRSDILDQLRGYIAQLRALKGTQISRLSGEGVLVPCMMMRSGGPFATIEEFHDWFVWPPGRETVQSIYWNQITTHLRNDVPIVFTHGDLAARNILVRDGKIVAILDWEFAGWYPEYWEYVFTLRQLDNQTWETLGLHVPSLFTKRYDLEYILVMLLLRGS